MRILVCVKKTEESPWICTWSPGSWSWWWWLAGVSAEEEDDGMNWMPAVTLDPLARLPLCVYYVQFITGNFRPVLPFHTPWVPYYKSLLQFSLESSYSNDPTRLSVYFKSSMDFTSYPSHSSSPSTTSSTSNIEIHREMHMLFCVKCHLMISIWIFMCYKLLMRIVIICNANSMAGGEYSDRC